MILYPHITGKATTPFKYKLCKNIEDTEPVSWRKFADLERTAF